MEQEKVTAAGNEPVVGFTSRLKFDGWPAGTDALAGVMPMVKSKLWLGVAVKLTAAECVIELESLPAATMLKV